jgi:hypothetical protein
MEQSQAFADELTAKGINAYIPVKNEELLLS